MKLRNLSNYLFLLCHFRNGWQMVQNLRGAPPCTEAVLWSGERLVHPEGRGGFVLMINEVWRDQGYTRGGFYEPADGDVILDVGANVGLFSIWLTRRNPKCRVLALEPSGENFRCLKANLAAFGLDQVDARPIALGAAHGEGRIQPASNRSIDHRLVAADQEVQSVGSKNHLFDNPPSREDEIPVQDKVEVIPLSAALDMTGSERIALLKMDIEGGEHDAFVGVDSETLSRIDRVAMEYHDNLRPGTLALLKEKLEPTHELRIVPEEGEEHGMLWGTRRS